MPWAGLIAAIPALAMAMQSYFEARGASRDAERTEERSDERDDKGWRFTRYILEKQQDEIEDLYERFLEDPASVDEAWRQRFEQLHQDAANEVPHGPVRERRAGILCEDRCNLWKAFDPSIRLTSAPRRVTID